ncbi:MAG TPA: ATP-binding protein [Nocardioidaceae bacterium]|nr:ATP-binding protein [Nocardioidaceae bacterium]
MTPVGVSGRFRVRVLRHPSAPALTVSGWIIGLLVTGLILGTPYLGFGYHSPSLHLVLDSIDACVGLLVAYLVYGRYLRSRQTSDLLLAQGLFLLAAAGFGLTVSLEVLSGSRPGTIDVWLPLGIRVLGAVLITASALFSSRRSALVRERWRRSAPWVLALVAFVVLWLLRDLLPVALDDSPPQSAQRPVITGHPMVLLAHGFTAVCFAVASVAFTAHAVRRHDELLRWLGPACALAAFARVNYVLFPSLYTDWLYTGDVLRTGCYLLLLVGAAREIRNYWTAHARALVLEDRRRLARELHDGVVQELGYIRAEAHRDPVDGVVSRRIVGACDRALDEARAAVDVLGRGPDEPLGLALRRGAQQVADRYDVQLEVDLDDSVTAVHDQRHALVRITREAVSNAVRHGGARRVHLGLAGDAHGRRLVVRDDGSGFDPETVPDTGSGYGLTSMRERALALPGSFRIESTPGKGTLVEVTW